MTSMLARELRDCLIKIEQAPPKERAEKAKEALLWIKNRSLPAPNPNQKSNRVAIALATTAIAGFLNEPENDFRNGCALGKAIVTCEWVATNKEILEGIPKFPPAA